MQNDIFHTNAYEAIQDKVLTYLNSRPDFLSSSTANSTRAVGDAIEDLVKSGLEEILGDLCSSYSSDFARRAMADLAFEDKNGFKYSVDVKTHRTSTEFNMPNLTSARRLANLYKDEYSYFVLLLVSYRVEGTKVTVSNVKFVPIEFLGWDCLTLGALGWGQIQISNSNRITIAPEYSRSQWMSTLCDKMLSFYPKEIEKITKRITFFEEVKEFWVEKDT